MKTREGRIYGENVTIREENVKAFWAQRAALSGDTKSTLLGNHGGGDLSKMQNERDNTVFRECVGEGVQRIIEFGCGNGRWGELLKDIVESYSGIDFTPEYLDQARRLFEGDGRFRFSEGALTGLPEDFIRAGAPYTVGICAGCVMYLNDDEAEAFYRDVARLPIYSLFLKESASTMEKRLTLVDFPSKELHADYNVVYRMPSEYEAFFRKNLPDFRIERKDWLYPQESGIWAETNSYYWHLSRM
ncbi:MAG: class I SAM-dependent methyltransferase [Kiritimatiellae bacterium]|nr:class I SAM-dependent methyltransferase [Kiritimatiellia bacterium]